MMKLKLYASVLVMVMTIAQASEASRCDLIPKNDLKIPVGANFYGGIDEDTFNRVIDNVYSFYAPIVAERGGKLKINRLWSDATVNASSERVRKNWIVNMYGGLARHHATTEDGFALVLCHELGHHLGGYPRSGFGEDWAANEGQADYFATMKCFRRVFENEDNASAVAQMQVPEIVKTKCAGTFRSPAQFNLCIRDSMTGRSLAYLLWSIDNDKRAHLATAPEPAFDTPDPTVVDEINDDHPAAQCRLDTYFNGSVCSKDFNEDFGQDDPVTGACAMENGDKLGYRPLCWYKPKSD